MTTCDRLLKYVRVHTTSDEDSDSTPSTARQFDLARMLQDELKDMGIDSYLDDMCYLYARIPATTGLEDKPAIGFIAHLDTSPEYSGKDVSPIVTKNYDGDDISLDNGIYISNKNFPHLKTLKGRTLITADGNTLLGADDKSGIAIIMTLAEYLTTHDVPHSAIAIAFTPDEEIGRGSDHFDVERFNCSFAYTIDGGAENELQYENFNAASAKVEFFGTNVHPGSAKDIMVNASLLATQFLSALPNERPDNTEGREGFYHLTSMEGDVNHATLSFIIRDHDSTLFEKRKEVMQRIAHDINKNYKENRVSVTIKDSYKNMLTILQSDMTPVKLARKAMQLLGIVPDESPIRGGTDGASLSFKGLPTPNLGTGGYAFHGPYEHITAEGMDTALNTAINIIKLYSDM
ncbi:MAG: peptidase T [Lachnospiraceae bacterium]|nr:peptidase T [Lachnospiraceae bacterium]